MTSTPTEKPQPTLIFSPHERSQLLRLCTRLTGDPAAADDLVQETMITAWQRLEQLTDPDGLSVWLATIARNHYRHWVRSQRRRQQYLIAADELANDGYADQAALTAVIDFDAAVDRKEIIDLLDRALAQLPAETQKLLVSHYVESTPHAELAAQLGIKLGALAGRLHRGKEMLRCLLITDFRHDALALGLIMAGSDWQTTRIWCSTCGQRRLRGRFIDGAVKQLLLQCDCGANLGFDGPADLLVGVQGFGPALNRARQWQHTLLQCALHTGTISCPRCMQAIACHRTPNTAPSAAPMVEPSFCTHCASCGWQLQMDLPALAGNFPISRHFGRAHPRLQTLPTRQLDYEGAPAVVVSTHSVTDSAHLDLIFHASTFALLYPLASVER